MSYEIVWADNKAKKSLDRFPQSTQARLSLAIKSLSLNPRPAGVKKLAGHLKGVWRLRMADYRLLYDIDDKSKKIILLYVDHRRQIYR